MELQPEELVFLAEQLVWMVLQVLEEETECMAEVLKLKHIW
jgi:hypothetical protein